MSLQALVNRTLQHATSLLKGLLLKDGALSESTSLSAYKDDFRNRQPGYSFVKASGLGADAGLFCLRQAVQGNASPGKPLLDAFDEVPEFNMDAAGSILKLTTSSPSSWRCS